MRVFIKNIYKERQRAGGRGQVAFMKEKVKS